VDRVDDAVLTPTRLPAARNRQAKRLAYPVRILGERALQEGDYGEGDGLGKVPFDRALGARGRTTSYRVWLMRDGRPVPRAPPPRVHRS
jgi:hypothetical protein